MAWISVDQKLLGRKLRALSKDIGCSQNEAIGILISLWLWGIDNADEEGLIVSADRFDMINAITPTLDKKLNAADVLEFLIKNKWLDSDEGELFIHDWGEWRKYYNRYMNNSKKSSERTKRYREKIEEEKRKKQEEEHTAPEPEETENQKAPAKGKQEPGESVESKKPKKGKVDYTADFEKFWSVYPRKVDKGEAFKKYVARLRSGFSEAELLEAATNYADSCRRNNTEQKYIKHAKTFLSDSTPFTDYINKNTEHQERTATRGNNPFL